MPFISYFCSLLRGSNISRFFSCARDHHQGCTLCFFTSFITKHYDLDISTQLYYFFLSAATCIPISQKTHSKRLQILLFIFFESFFAFTSCTLLPVPFGDQDARLSFLSFVAFSKSSLMFTLWFILLQHLPSLASYSFELLLGDINYILKVLDIRDLV
jgi:hypothetical protein